MQYSLIVTFDADTPEEANSIAADVEQTLSGRDLTDYLGTYGPSFPHAVHVDRSVRLREGEPDRAKLMAQARANVLANHEDEVTAEYGRLYAADVNRR